THTTTPPKRCSAMSSPTPATTRSWPPTTSTGAGRSTSSSNPGPRAADSGRPSEPPLRSPSASTRGALSAPSADSPAPRQSSSCSGSPLPASDYAAFRVCSGGNAFRRPDQGGRYVENGEGRGATDGQPLAGLIVDTAAGSGSWTLGSPSCLT